MKKNIIIWGSSLHAKYTIDILEQENKYHIACLYDPTKEGGPEIFGYRIFGKNDDFLGKKLENEPIKQLEAHLTQDFTPTFFASLDLLYRGGFQSEINGVEVGEELDIGNIGFTLNFQILEIFFHCCYFFVYHFTNMFYTDSFRILECKVNFIF